MTGQPWLAGQVVPKEFFFLRVLQFIFDQKGSARIFWPPGGHATSENISRVFKMFSFVYVCFVCRHYAAKFKVMLGKLLDCKAQLLEINRAPTAR